MPSSATTAARLARRSRRSLTTIRPRRSLTAASALALTLAGVVAATPASAQTEYGSVTVPGTHGLELGCVADWDIDCPALTLDPATGLFTGTFDVPAGDYQYWVYAVTTDWSGTFLGVDGEPGGPKGTYTTDGGPITFTFDPDTRRVAVHNGTFAPVAGDSSTDASTVPTNPELNANLVEARWIDETTIAFPAWAPAPAGGLDRPGEVDAYTLYGSEGELSVSYANDPAGEMVSTSGEVHAIPLTRTFFTPAQKVENPDASRYIALSVPAEHADADWLHSGSLAVGRIEDQWVDEDPDMWVAVRGLDPLRDDAGTSVSAPAIVAADGTVRELGLEAASGDYRGDFDLPAGTYTLRADADGVSTGLDHPGGPLTVVYETTSDTFQNSVAGIHTVAGSWNQLTTSSMGYPMPAGADLTQLLTDADGDGIYTYTAQDIPSGAYYADEATNLPRTAELGPMFTTAGGPVTFTYEAATDTLTAEPENSGVFDANAERARWVDADTIAYPADLGGDVASDVFHVYWTDQDEFRSTWTRWDTSGELQPLDGPFSSSIATLRPGSFTEAQLAADPTLADHVALDLVLGDGSEALPADFRETGSLAVYQAEQAPTGVLTYRAVVGVTPGVPDAPEQPGQPEQPVDPAEPGVPVNVILTAGDAAAAAREFGLPVPDGADVVAGDWDGDGVDTLAWRAGNRFTFTSANVAGGGELSGVWYGKRNDEVLVGDWDGDGRDTLGIRRGNEIHLSNGLYSGRADVFFWYGRPSDDVVIGDFDGDGDDTVSVRRHNQFHINDELRSGNAQHTFYYGKKREEVLVGDLDGDGKDSISIRRGSEYHLKNSLATGNADRVVRLGDADDTGLLGDWDGDGTDTLGVFVR